MHARRKMLGAAACLSISGLAGTLSAQEAYPAKPVKLLLPLAAGGGADALARLIAQKLSEVWGKPVVVDNRPGAGTTIGAGIVAKSPSDGYTVLMTTVVQAVSPAAYPNLQYNVLNDFAPVATLSQTPGVLVAHPSLGAASLADFIRIARAQRRALNFGTPGNGTFTHLVYELVRQKLDIDATVVHYRGSAPALTALLANEVQIAIDTPAAVAQHVSAGRIRAYAVTTRQSSKSMPGVPSFVEAGAGDIDASIWFALFAPAGTPRPIVQKIYSDVAALMTAPDVAPKLVALGQENMLMSPDQFNTFFRGEVSKWGDVVRRAGIKFES